MHVILSAIDYTNVKVSLTDSFAYFFFFRTVSSFNSKKTLSDTFTACWVILLFPQSTELSTWTTGSLTCVCGLFAYVFTRGTSV